jgi:AraC-like DNA-binding protein
MSEAPRQVLRAPRAELADFVEKLWLVEAPAQPHARERILPDGSMTLVVNLADDEVRTYAPDGACARLRGSSVHGAQDAPFVIDTAEQSQVVGVHFKPGGAYPFFGVGVGELRGRHVSLPELWGAAADSLRSELLEARSDAARFAAIERALLRRVTAAPPRRHAGMLAALRALASQQPPERVATLADRLGVSPRRLASRFEDEVGLAPRVACSRREGTGPTTWPCRSSDSRLATSRIRCVAFARWAAHSARCEGTSKAKVNGSERAPQPTSIVICPLELGCSAAPEIKVYRTVRSASGRADETACARSGRTLRAKSDTSSMIVLGSNSRRRSARVALE